MSYFHDLNQKLPLFLTFELGKKSHALTFELTGSALLRDPRYASC